MSLLECSHFYNNKYKNACQIKKRLDEPLFIIFDSVANRFGY